MSHKYLEAGWMQQNGLYSLQHLFMLDLSNCSIKNSPKCISTALPPDVVFFEGQHKEANEGERVDIVFEDSEEEESSEKSV